MKNSRTIVSKTKYIGCLVTPTDKEYLTELAKFYEIKLAELIRYSLKEFDKNHNQSININYISYANKTANRSNKES